jgi:hypothetical protein
VQPHLVACLFTAADTAAPDGIPAAAGGRVTPPPSPPPSLAAAAPSLLVLLLQLIMGKFIVPAAADTAAPEGLPAAGNVTVVPSAALMSRLLVLPALQERSCCQKHPKRLHRPQRCWPSIL